MKKSTRGSRSSANSHTSTRPAPQFALRQETLLAAMAAMLLSLLSLAYCFPRGMLLLYGDAVAHLHIARRLTDSINPGFRQLGSVWLPLPHLLLAPFVRNMAWWQTGLAGAWPSMISYIIAVAALYRLARLWLKPLGASIAATFLALNPGLLYMQTTAMTEPLFLAEMLVSALLTAECAQALKRGEERKSSRLMVAAALVLVAAVFTRYDGWIFAACAWLVIAITMIRGGHLRQRSGGAFVLLTALLLTAPLCWLAYNAKQFGDPLDFMRGPYSAKAIEARTATPGAPHYPGWHSMGVAGLYFLKAAELGAVIGRLANLLFLVAIAGTAVAVKQARGRGLGALLLLWMPLPFYAYSVAYGAVPIFIPLWWPHSWYNTRYGMEMLPAFALFTGFAATAAIDFIRQRKPELAQWSAATLMLLLAANSYALMRARPLVLAEAVANSRTRIPFEEALANALISLPVEGRILMFTSDHVGALQRAGLPLRRTINDTDYYEWGPALKNPAAAAPFAVAMDGDPLAKAIAAHPAGLTLIDVVCSTGQPCARIYRSEIYGAGGSISTK